MYDTMQNQDDYQYKKVVLNKVFREEDKSPEMRNWSIFSNNVRYVQHEQMTPQTFNIDTLDYRQHKDLYLELKGEERETLDIDFGTYSDILKSKYLDIYEGVYAEMVYVNKFNKNSGLSMTYLGQIEMMRDTKIKAEERFPITGQGFTSGKLLDGTECQILFDTGAMKSYMSKSNHAMQNATHTTEILFQHSENSSGKWTICQCTFVIPVIIDINRHRFEIFTLVSEIRDNVDLVMGMKNIFKLEGMIDLQDSCFSFLSR